MMVTSGLLLVYSALIVPMQVPRPAARRRSHWQSRRVRCRPAAAIRRVESARLPADGVSEGGKVLLARSWAVCQPKCPPPPPPPRHPDSLPFGVRRGKCMHDLRAWLLSEFMQGSVRKTVRLRWGGNG